jgi:hypothetical protein
MKKNEIIFILIIFLLFQTIFGIVVRYHSLFIIGHLLILPMVGIWYGYIRHWRYEIVDKYIYLAFLVGAPSDIMVFLKLGERGSFIQISLTLIMNLLFILVFRREGTMIYINKFREMPKLVFPAMIVIMAFGLLVVPLVTDSLYFILIFYSVIEILLMSHGYFRPIKGMSYFWVALGVTFIFIKDVLYCINFFVFENTLPQLYITHYILSVIAYFMIALGIAINQNNNNETFKKKTKKKPIFY